MKITKKVVFSVAYLVLASSCGAKWSVSNPRFFRYQNHDVRVVADIEMTDRSHQIIDGKKGADFETRLYSDDYSTMLYTNTTRAGKELEEYGNKDVNQVYILPITQYRLGGTWNSYPYLCAEIRMEDSNVSEWTRVGCIHYTDDPSESPTGEDLEKQNERTLP